MISRRISAAAAPAVHRAGWVVAAPDRVIRDGYVVAAGGRITGVGRGNRFPTDIPVIDHGPGAIAPLLVNTHTHLELSALPGKLPMGQGFRKWVRRLLEERAALGSEALAAGVFKGIDDLAAGGCGVVAEVSTLGVTWEPLRSSGLAGVWFREVLGGAGTEIEMPETAQKSLLTASVAGHAPHTTDPALLRRLEEEAGRRGLPFSLHIDESADESEFITTGKGAWADFLTERGIDFSGWPIPAAGAVQYAERLGILGGKTLAVHLIHARAKEFDILRRRGVHVCICPRSNRNLHGSLPDLPGMIAAGLAPCLGTDSLASTESLSMFDEMRFCARSYPDVPPATIFAMATRNGAAALQLADHFGSLAPGKSAVMLYLPMTGANPADLMDRIINHDEPCNVAA